MEHIPDVDSIMGYNSGHDTHSQAESFPSAEGDTLNLTLGENGRVAFLSTDSAALDFFFQVVPQISSEKLIVLLEAVWDEDPHTALGLIFQTGNSRLNDGGKMDQENFHACLLWLMQNHPSTLLANLRAIPSHTYLKDLLLLVAHASNPSSDVASLTGKRKAKDHKDLIRTKKVKRQRQVDRDKRRIEFKKEFAEYMNVPLDELYVLDEETNAARDALAQQEREKTRKKDEYMKLKKQEFDNMRRQVVDTFSSRMQLHEEEPVPLDFSLGASSLMRWVTSEVKFKWDAYVKTRDNVSQEKAKEVRTEKKLARKEKRTQYAENQVSQQGAGVASNFTECLMDTVSDIFAEGLLSENVAYNNETVNVAGLYAKWAPSLHGSQDKTSNIVDMIASKVFLKDLDGYISSDMGSDIGCALPPSIAMDIRRMNYGKMLTALRTAAKIPEHFIGTGDWNNVDYDRMSSRCRLLYGQKLFFKHDEVRYMQFLKEAREAAVTTKEPGDKVKSVKVGALLPHEVTSTAWKAQSQMYHDSGDDDSDDDKGQGGATHGKLREDKIKAHTMALQQCDLQWRGIVDKCKDSAHSGEGVGCWIPVCDVSGSMSGEPMEVAVALSLLLAEVNTKESGWYGKMFTFNSTPELVTVIDETNDGGEGGLVDIGDVVQRTRAMDWGGSTNIDLTMDLFLAHTIAAGTSPQTLTKQAVVIFSDMEFDQANHSNIPWETAHDAITTKFTDAGYPSAPLIVYWNLRASESTPVQQKNTPGVLLLSGFSAGLLRSFLSGKLDEFTPEAQLNAILEKDVYKSLVVVV
jgi:hypothetical protein